MCQWVMDIPRSVAHHQAKDLKQINPARCPYPSTEVDHIVPIEQNGKRFDRENLQALCKHHHSIKTARENGFGG